MDGVPPSISSVGVSRLVLREIVFVGSNEMQQDDMTVTASESAEVLDW